MDKMFINFLGLKISLFVILAMSINLFRNYAHAICISLENWPFHKMPLKIDISVMQFEFFLKFFIRYFDGARLRERYKIREHKLQTTFAQYEKQIVLSSISQF